MNLRARALQLSTALSLLSFALHTSAPAARAQGQQPAGQAAVASAAPAHRKKVAPGARGFELFAGRDASDKLITGAATRGGLGEAQVQSARGLELYQAGHLPEAAAVFKHVVELAPDWAEARYNLATVYAELGQYDEAAAEFRRALGQKPEERLRVLITYNLGNALFEAGEYQQAEDAFAETARLFPNVAQPHYNLALAYVGLGELGRAVEAFQEALRLNPDYEEARYNLAVAYLQLGRRDEAAAEQGRLAQAGSKWAAKLARLLKSL